MLHRDPSLALRDDLERWDAEREGDVLASGFGQLHAAVASGNHPSLLQILQIPADAGGADIHFFSKVFHRGVLGFIEQREDLAFPFAFIHG